MIPRRRSEAPIIPLTVGPFVQESRRKRAEVGVHRNLIRIPAEEDLFDHYASSQLALFDLGKGEAKPLGQAGVFPVVEPSPNGKLLLVTQLCRPYSRSRPHSEFPRVIAVWNRRGAIVQTVATRLAGEDVPRDGVPSGRREFSWHPLKPSTLIWVEALDDGDPAKEISDRDRVMMLAAPFETRPHELVRTRHRFSNLRWTSDGSHVLVSDYERDRHWRTTLLIETGKSKLANRTLWSYDSRDHANRPGSPLSVALPNGRHAVYQTDDSIFIAGEGGSTSGPRPFLDCLDLRSLKTQRLFQSAADCYEEVVALVLEDDVRFITRRESSTDPPNYIIREIPKRSSPACRPSGRSQLMPARCVKAHSLIRFYDHSRWQSSIQKRLITYQRADGVQLSCVLYLPPDYQAGTRLPAVLWSYPHEFSDSHTAGQVTVCRDRFTTLRGASPLFLLLEGYAILHQAAMPIVGESCEVNNSYIEQITMNAKAAIDKVVEMGVVDRERVGVGGHSYGAAMAANLLAHSDLFRAGVALSGAYNRTLSPFGFQNERRTLWEDERLYMQLSPLLYAHRIKTPLLLVHGELDDNSGTPALQSQRMYDAISVNGGTTRLVLLPHEGHTYVARESVEHVLSEMAAWFNFHIH